MHIDQAVSDSRMGRDWFSIASRSALPFGSGYHSTIRSLASTANATTEYRLFPSQALGHLLSYGEPQGILAALFPSGLSSIAYPRLGSNPLPARTTSIVAINCVATLDPSPLTGPRAIVTAISPNASLVISQGLPLPSNVVTLEMTGDNPWIVQGLPGYALDGDRAPGTLDVVLPGITPITATLTLNPTFPEVLLFLWVALFGSVNGLDVPSVKAMAALCQSKGLFYNGDVRPDRFEAWIYQAAHSHGCRVNRSRNGLTLAAMGSPTLDATARLLTNVNSRSLTRSWEYGDRVPQSRTRYGLQGLHNDVQEVSTVFIPVFMPTRSEELLGIRIGDTLHIETVAKLWVQERSLDTQYAFELTTGNIGLTLENVCAISESGGYVVGQTALGVQGSWGTVLVSGRSDTLTSQSLTDVSKDFARVAIGDTVELSIAGLIVHGLVTSSVGSTVTFAPPLTEVPIEAGYRVLKTSGSAVVSWQLPGQPIVQATVTPVYSPEVRSVVYPLPTTLPKGTPMAVGALELARVSRITGPIITAIG